MCLDPVDDIQQAIPDICQLQNLEGLAGDPFEQEGLTLPSALDQGGKVPGLAALAQHVQGIVECIHPDRPGHLVRAEHPVAQFAHLDPVVRQCA